MSARWVLAITVLAGVLGACSSPAPSATLSATAPSPSEVAGILPQPGCEQPPQVTTTDESGNEVAVEITLICEKAVEAAVELLPADHLPILGVEFHYGTYCPPGWACPATADIAQRGYVVFLTASRGIQRGIWVQMRADDAGDVEVIAGPDPFPPIGRLDS